MVSSYMKLEVIIMGKKLKIETDIGNIKVILCSNKNNEKVEENDHNMHEIGYGVNNMREKVYYIYANKASLTRQEKFEISQWLDDVIPIKAKDCRGITLN